MQAIEYVGDHTEIKWRRRMVIAVDTVMAEALCRPAQAHTIVEIHRAAYIMPDRGPGPEKRWVLQTQIRIL